MKGDALPDEHHVIRYVKRRFVEIGSDGAPDIQGSAFWSRPIDNNEASYNWLECYPGSAQDQVTEIRRASRLRYMPRDRLAKLNVGFVLERLKTEFTGTAIRLLHDPIDADENNPLPDPSHSLMVGMPAEGEPLVQAIGDLIAECLLESYPALVE